MKLARLYWAQHGRCFHCNELMTLSPAMKKKDGQYNMGWTREHVLPKSKGGKNQKNVVLACMPCNSKRGNNLPSEKMLARCAEIWRIGCNLKTKTIKTALMNPAMRQAWTS